MQAQEGTEHTAEIAGVVQRLECDARQHRHCGSVPHNALCIRMEVSLTAYIHVYGVYSTEYVLPALGGAARRLKSGNLPTFTPEQHQQQGEGIM